MTLAFGPFEDDIWAWILPRACRIYNIVNQARLAISSCCQECARKPETYWPSGLSFLLSFFALAMNSNNHENCPFIKWRQSASARPFIALNFMDAFVPLTWEWAHVVIFFYFFVISAYLGSISHSATFLISGAIEVFDIICLIFKNRIE